MNPSNRKSCRLCRRIPKRGTSQHHLIPRTCHSNRWFKRNYTRQQMQQTIDLCSDCHRAVHRFVPREKDLGREYFTVERLLNHLEIRKFVGWVRKQR